MDNSPSNITLESMDDGTGVEMLTSACSKGDEDEVAKLLKEHGLTLINKKDTNGNAPIHIACQAGLLSIVRLLLKQGADRSTKNGCGASPLQTAIFGDHLEIVQLLSKKDPRKELNTLDLTQSQLQYAAIFGRTRILEWLLQNGADANAPWTGGRTAAHFVCALAEGNSQAVDCLNSLVKHGADLTIQDDEGRMPIHVVRSVAIMETLIDRWGVDVNTLDGNSWTPLHHSSAAISGCEEVCRFLLRKEADLHAVTGDGDTPLHLSMRHGLDTAKILLEQDTIDIAAKDGRGRNPLHLIMAHQKPEKYIIHFLKTYFLPSGCDIDDSTDMGWTPFHFAVFYNLFNVLEVLLEGGASMTKCNSTGQTPLHMVGTKNFRFTGGEEEKALHEALDGTIPSHRKSSLRDPFPLPSNEAEDYKVRLANVLWPAQHGGVYDSLLSRGADCTKRDKEGNLPFFLAAATDWLDATFCMIRTGASQGLFEQDMASVAE